MGSWSPDHRKQHSLGLPSSILSSASQASPHFQSIRQTAPPPLHSTHHHLGHSHSMSDLSGLDSMKSMTLENGTPRHPASSYNPLNNLHLHIPADHYVDDSHTDEWPQSATSSTFPQDDVKYSHIHQTFKAEHQSMDHYTQHNLFDVSSQAPHNPHIPYPHSPPYSQHVVHAYLDGKQHPSSHGHLYHQSADQFVHPDELSPSGSASSEYDSIDPRFVSGVHHPGNESSDSWNEHSERLIDSRGQFVRNGYDEVDDDAEGDHDDYEEDDESDSDYVARGHRRTVSAAPADHRTLRRRTRSQRFNPYGGYIGSERTDMVPDEFPPLNRTRRAASSATTTSTSSSLSEISTAVYSMTPPRRRARAATALPIPVPVPHLTKKSRGRRVPTVGTVAVKGDPDAEDSPGKKRTGRQYACKVPGCGKCFARGEHLKRHVRSIHTYEKRSSISITFHALIHHANAHPPSQRTNARILGVARTSAVTTTWGSTCASTRTSRRHKAKRSAVSNQHRHSCHG